MQQHGGAALRRSGAAGAAGSAPLVAQPRGGFTTGGSGRRRGWASGAIAADRPPAAPGDAVADVDTPALLLDLDVFESNCRRLRRIMEAYPSVSIRPHAKAHKCPEVAALQLQLLGPQARGVCGQKVSEAEALVAGGVADVLLSNQVVAPRKLRRLAALAAAGARVGVCVDDAGALRDLAAAARAEGAEVEVLVEINAGQDRCGVETPAEAARLAEAAAGLTGVRFGGIQAYHGGLQHVRDPSERAAAVAAVARRAEAAVAAIKAAGLECGTVTGGGSGTFQLEAASGVFTEVQPGSFAFGDADYARNGQEGGAGGLPWGVPGTQALFVLTQVMSVSPARACAVVDAGLKAVALDSGPPIVDASWGAAAAVGVSAAEADGGAPGGGYGAGGAGPSNEGGGPMYKCAGDEHGLLLWPLPGAAHQLGPPALPARGDLFRLQPGHCDPTVNLFDWVVACRGESVEAVWRVAARGPGS